MYTGFHKTATFVKICLPNFVRSYYENDFIHKVDDMVTMNMKNISECFKMLFNCYVDKTG